MAEFADFRSGVFVDGAGGQKGARPQLQEAEARDLSGGGHPLSSPFRAIHLFNL